MFFNKFFDDNLPSLEVAKNRGAPPAIDQKSSHPVKTCLLLLDSFLHILVTHFKCYYTSIFANSQAKSKIACHNNNVYIPQPKAIIMCHYLSAKNYHVCFY